jgi:ATP-dependent Clp protease ATP-binding subunit ClpA
MITTPTPDLRQLGHFLRGEILGQSEACETAVKAILRGELGYGDPGRPRSFLLFLGETGVGKTEMTLSLARFLFGSDEYVIRLDMRSLARSVPALLAWWAKAWMSRASSRMKWTG